MSKKIYSLDLLDQGISSPFVIRTMEEISLRQEGIADDLLLNDEVNDVKIIDFVEGNDTFPAKASEIYHNFDCTKV